MKDPQQTVCALENILLGPMQRASMRSEGKSNNGAKRGLILVLLT
jgi:hypothetical protein